MVNDNFDVDNIIETDLYCDVKSFDLNRYKKVLNKLSMFGKFISPTENSLTKNSFFLRHDIDLSLQNAHLMFKIEKEIGIKSHFYFRTGSPTYTINSLKFKEFVAEMQQYGACIGLHFERFNHKKSEDYEFKMQIDLLENSINAEIIHFSPHNPGSLLKTKVHGLSYKYINAYSFVNEFQFGYISDSNGSWKENYLIDFLKHLGKKPYQILIHPEWWTDKSLDPLSRIIDVYSNSYLENLNEYAGYHKNSSKFDEGKITKFESQVNLISKSISDIIK
jgi:hypothetical protein